MKARTLIVIGLVTLLASATQASQEQLARSIQETHAETKRTSEQLKGTLAAINALTEKKRAIYAPIMTFFARR